MRSTSVSNSPLLGEEGEKREFFFYRKLIKLDLERRKILLFFFWDIKRVLNIFFKSIRWRNKFDRSTSFEFYATPVFQKAKCEWSCTRVVSEYLEIPDETLRTSSPLRPRRRGKKVLLLYFQREEVCEKREWMLNKFFVFNPLCRKKEERKKERRKRDRVIPWNIIGMIYLS